MANEIIQNLGWLNLAMGTAYFFTFIQTFLICKYMYASDYLQFATAFTKLKGETSFFFAIISLVTLTVAYQHFFDAFGEVVYVWRAGLAWINAYLTYKIRKVFKETL